MRTRTALMSLATICSLAVAPKVRAEWVDELSSSREQLGRLVTEVIPNRARRVSAEGQSGGLIRQEGVASLRADAIEVFAIYDIDYRYSFATEFGTGETVRCHGEVRVYHDFLAKRMFPEIILEEIDAFPTGRNSLIANLRDLNCEIVNP